MWRTVLSVFVLLLGPTPLCAQDYQPSFNPAEIEDRAVGAPNQVMVLGTPHLRGLPDSFRPEMVDPLVERLWSVDDQSTFMGELEDPDAYGAVLMAAWDNPAGDALRHQRDALYEGLGEEGGLFAMYRAYNDPTFAYPTYQSDFGAALLDPSPEGYGRSYVAYWETRNLRMVANIREVLGRQPGNRMLAIVVSSHKG